MRAMAAALAIALVAGVPATPALAARGENFHLLKAGVIGPGAAVTMYNYDFQHPTRARANNVDWPVTLIFRNNASLDAVNDGLRPLFPYAGRPVVTPAYFRANSGGDRHFWTSNKGRKTATCTAGTRATHFRAYGDPRFGRGGRLFTLGLGYFVVATSHFDINECAGATDSTAGYPDDASHTVTADARVLNPDWQVYDDVYDARNSESLRQQGSHIYLNDGLASMITIP